MLYTLLKPTAGRITYDGEDLFADYLQYIALIKGPYPAVARRWVQELLSQVGLLKVQHKKIKKLSGGMKRSAGIAQAILNDPRILILDEPTAGLDPNERIRFQNLISELSEERLVLLSTHIVSDVEYIVNEVLLMQDGQIAHSGTQEEILRDVPVRVWTCTVSRVEADAV
ncbi:ATP-binding cassette domain-containing protein [Ruminococcus sp. OA3]|uniref:ATP-binding cassette domain-containing protein n=1 Tax=Ruminococcus sp. OA3 TaxID=2914164 RepID=UPI0031F4C850